MQWFFNIWLIIHRVDKYEFQSDNNIADDSINEHKIHNSSFQNNKNLVRFKDDPSPSTLHNESVLSDDGNNEKALKKVFLNLKINFIFKQLKNSFL